MNRVSQFSFLHGRPKRLLSKVRRRLKTIIGAPQQMLDRWRGRQLIHFLHIGKTGGTAVKHALKTCLEIDNYLILLHNHKVRLRDVPKGDKVIFFVRDPIKRFVSGFYGRQRQDLPRHFSPWSRDEKIAFKHFSTPNELAAALSSEDIDRRNLAVKAMKSIKHVRSSYWDWFGSEAYLLSRISDVFFIGFQESLDGDFQRLKDKLGLPETVKLPKNDLEAHKNPQKLDRRLEEVSIRNLNKWYAEDYAFIELCRKLANAINQVEPGIDISAAG